MILLLAGIWLVVILFVLAMCRAAAHADEQDERAARRLVSAGQRSGTIGLVTAATALGAHQSAPSAEARTCASSSGGASTAELAAALTCRISAARERHGLDGLHRRKRLAVAARRYADDMATHDFFSHVSPSGARLRDRVDAAHYAGRRCSWHVGEVLAWSSGDNASAEWTVRAWLHSATHRRVLLTRDYDDVGVGVVAGDPVGDDAQRAITVSALLGSKRCPS
jgi:uncharacterized protein YkwD